MSCGKGVVIVAIVLAACAKGAPDERALGTMVASIVVDEEVIAMDRAIVIDQDSLALFPPELEEALRERLNATSPGWLTAEVVRNFDSMPGEWEEVEGLGRVNRTHQFITFSIDGGRSNRYLKYMRSYCALCGGGERILLTWDGRGWKRETLVRIRL